MIQEEFIRSLDNPHPETLKFAEAGLTEWAQSLPVEDIADLVDPSAGIPVRWIPGVGWVEGSD